MTLKSIYKTDQKLRSIKRQITFHDEILMNKGQAVVVIQRGLGQNNSHRCVFLARDARPSYCTVCT